MNSLRIIREKFQPTCAEAYDGVNISYYSCGGSCEGGCGWSPCQGDCEGSVEGWEGLP
ncbi:MAG: hypothetical protein IJ597_05610 [Synergistaceae bacterium]|nr:hypothetical protein [Synergistaceae bacterium]